MTRCTAETESMIDLIGQFARASERIRVMIKARNLTDLSSHWIDRVHGHHPVRMIVFDDIDTGVSPIYGIRKAQPILITPETLRRHSTEAGGSQPRLNTLRSTS